MSEQMNIRAIPLTEVAVLEKKVSGKKSAKAGDPFKLTDVEYQILNGLKLNLAETKVYAALVLTGNDVGSGEKKATGIKQSVNKTLVEFGRKTGLGYHAAEVTGVEAKKAAEKMFGDHRAVVVKYYGTFDEKMYRTEIGAREAGVGTAYEEPSEGMVRRIDHWIDESGVMKVVEGLPLMLTAGDGDRVEEFVKAASGVWKRAGGSAGVGSVVDAEYKVTG
jgi:hypothetical protein